MKEAKQYGTTIELTHKKWKFLKALSFVPIVLGILFFIGCLFSGKPAGGAIVFSMLLFGAGFGLYIASRILIWWHHK
jgi:hypothetical protein